jgi:hypothetical protein
MGSVSIDLLRVPTIMIVVLLDIPEHGAKHKA